MTDVLSELVVTATAIQPVEGGMVAVGFFETENDQSPFVLVRFHPGGLDDRFGQSGVVTAESGRGQRRRTFVLGSQGEEFFPITHQPETASSALQHLERWLAF